MGKSFAVLMMLSFVGIAVFGFLAMSHENSHGYGCIAATASGMNCLNDVTGIALLHIGTFKGFSTALIGQPIVSLLALLVLALGAGISLTSSWKPVPLCFFARKKLVSRSPYSPLKTEFTRWIALHENSPSWSLIALI